MEVVRLSDTIASDLEKRILEGSLRAGERLPGERELAAELGVSRPSLREALQKLAQKGLVRTRQGGGTVVTDRLLAGFIDPWRDMLSGHPGLQQDMLEFRFLLEAEAARLAAERATEADLEQIEAAHAALERAYDADDLEACVAADVAFHQSIAEASHNALIAHLSASLHRLVHEHVDRNLRYLHGHPEQWSALREQHRAIWLDLQQRQAARAADAARRHIEFVRVTMDQTAREVQRELSARRRAQAAGA